MKTRVKHLAKRLRASILLCGLLAAAAHAAVPLSWETRPGSPAPVSFDRHHGETIDFRCTLHGFGPEGQTVFGPNADVRLYYQTNGMGQAWWSAPATVSSNVITATWSPALDPGAERVALFFGAPSNVYASAVLRLRHSPGFTPSELTLPVQRLDFAAVEIANAPYYTKAETDAKIVELAPAPDFTTGNTQLVATIETTAPAPGDYVRKTGGEASNLAVDGLNLYPLKGVTLGTSSSDLVGTLLGQAGSSRPWWNPGGVGPYGTLKELAYLADIPAPPGDYASVSNRAMEAVQPSALASALAPLESSVAGKVDASNGGATNLTLHGELKLLDVDGYWPLVIHPYYSGQYFWFGNGREGSERRNVYCEFPADRDSAYLAFRHDVAFAADAATNYTDWCIQHTDPTIPEFDVYAEDVTNVAEAVTTSWTLDAYGPTNILYDVAGGTWLRLVEADGASTNVLWDQRHAVTNLSAAYVRSGVLDAARIPGLAASKIASGTFDAARIPAITSAKIADGTIVNADVSASAAISGSKLANASVTDAKIASVSASKVTREGVATNVVAYATGVLDVSIADGAALNASTNGWPDGAAVFARLAPAGSYTVDSALLLAGYGFWPTNSAQCVFWRSGAAVYCTVLLEEAGR